MSVPAIAQKYLEQIRHVPPGEHRDLPIGVELEELRTLCEWVLRGFAEAERMLRDIESAEELNERIFGTHQVDGRNP